MASWQEQPVWLADVPMQSAVSADVRQRSFQQHACTESACAIDMALEPGRRTEVRVSHRIAQRRHNGASCPMQSAPPAEAQQWAQEQQAYKDSVRTSTPATIQNALQNFNSVQINPSKLYAPGAAASNTAPLSPEQQPQAQPQPAATPQALGPATVVCEPPLTSPPSIGQV